MAKFFVQKDRIKEHTIHIVGEDVKHISKVLRLTENDNIVICDGQGYDYHCIIKSIKQDVVEVEIQEKIFSHTEPKCEVVLFQGLPKGDKMDLIIQKATELGISQIYPVITDRTIVKIKDPKKEQQKIARWQKIAQEACKQSNRSKIPKVHDFISFSHGIDLSQNFDIMLMPYEREEKKRINDVLKGHNQISKVGILIGPEGGFEDKEIEFALKKKIELITLGSRILRTETAGFVTLALIMNWIGEI